MLGVEMMRGTCLLGALVVASMSTSCSKSTDLGSQGNPPGPATVTRSAEPVARTVVPAMDPSRPAPSATTPAPKPFDPTPYPWLADGTVESLPAVEALEERIAPPPGFTRVELAPDSFGAWLRRLPLAAQGTPVRKFSGGVLLGPDHANVASVVAIDSGKADLQQCADSIMRMHAEWMWSQGRRDMSYRAAAGTPLPYERWARGERVVQKGMGIEWVPSSRPSSDHGSFRKFLDTVFAWANTVSLDRQAKKVTLDALRPGDFVILPGNPGHTVLFLDLAVAKDGRRVALLGQGYMPAQGFYVLRPNQNQTWFEVVPEQGAISTPFWDPFPWTSLRRLDD